MTWEIVAGIIALVGAVISIASPLLRLNTSITKLNCSVDALGASMKLNDDRITKHGKQIDKLEHRVTILEAFYGNKGGDG